MARRSSRRSDNAKDREQDNGVAIPNIKGAIQNSHNPMMPLRAEQLDKVHDMSMRILEELGIELMSAHARQICKNHGCQVDEVTHIVRMDRDLVMEMITRAPAQFTLTPRNADNAIIIGGNYQHFGLVSGPPNIHDCINGRRPGNFEDYCKLIKLAQSFDAITFLGNQATSPIEMPVNNRHLDTYKANIMLSDKVWSSISIGQGRTTDAAKMVAIGRNISLDEMAKSPSMMTNINVNSPRKLDDTMADGAIALARMGQAVIVTPFTLMGAMTPITMAAALAQQNAEALFGIAMLQMAHPGALCIYGGFTSNVAMRSGAPAFGTPENAKANLCGGQLARHYNLPYRTSGCNASNVVDAQAVYETQMSLWSAVMGHGNMIYHAAGWLEGGLVASFEKLVVDVEILHHMIKFLEPINTDDAEFGLEAIEQIGPGGHFFGCDHTMERYKTAFYEPFLSDWQNQENWQLSGSKTATMRATEIWQQVLNNYTAPPIDAAIEDELDAFIAHRKEQIGTDDP